MLLPIQIKMIRAWSTGNTILLARRAGKTYAYNLLKKVGTVALS